jgi:alkaline phosphatase D
MQFSPLLPENPQLKFYDDRYRGYLLCTVGRNIFRGDMRMVDNVRVREGKFSTLKSFAVEAGKPGPQPS